MATEPNIKLEVLQGGANGRDEAVAADSDPAIARTPGQILRQARQQQGLEQVDICDRLRLQPWVVEALEEDEYHRLAAPTYARGYLCNYANLLEIPEAEVLSAYDLVRADKPASAANAKRMVNGSETRAAGADGPSKWAPMVGLALLLGVIGLFAAWWFGDRGAINDVPGYAESGAVEVSDAPSLNPFVAEESQPAADEPTDDELSAGVAVEPAAAPPVMSASPASNESAANEAIAVNNGVSTRAPEDDGNAESELSAEMIAAAQAEAAFEAQQAGGVAPVDDSSVESSAQSTATTLSAAEPAITPEPAASSEVVTVDGIPLATTYPLEEEPVNEPTFVDDSSSAVYADDGRISISLYFQQDSWAEVRDANGSKLVYRLGQAGTSADVRGYPPFRVFLGNSPGVEVQLNGSPYDTSQHHRPNNTARFRIGADS